jgi:hypothetical protein
LSYDLRTLSDNIDSHIKDIANMVNLLLTNTLAGDSTLTERSANDSVESGPASIYDVFSRYSKSY